jgi:hypothetical protein
LDHRVFRDLLVYLVQLVHKVRQALRVIRDLLVLLDLKVHKVHLD